jgi:hypothetical protein
LHGKRYVTVRPAHDLAKGVEAYALRYHETDVVLWERLSQGDDDREPGDYVTVRGWSSMSTETFAGAYTPWNLRFNLHLDEGYFARVAMARSDAHAHTWREHLTREDARCFEFDRSMTFKYDPEARMAFPYKHSTTTKFIDPSPRLQRTALVKEGYFDFVKWLNAVLSLEGRPVTLSGARSAAERLAIANADDALRGLGPIGLLADPNKWMHFVNAQAFRDDHRPHSVIARADAIKRTIMDAIYRKHKAVAVRDVEWYPWSQFESQREMRKKYPWALY